MFGAMDYDDFLGLLGLEDPQALVSRIRSEVRWVYRFNADRHEEGLDDQQTFGFNVYRHSWRRVEDALAGLPGVTIGRPKNSFEIRVTGGARIHMYRGGVDNTFDIYGYDLNGGSETKASLPFNNELQLSLFDGGLYGPAANLRELVLVHAGNPQQGLTGLWVGAPRSRELSGAQWAWVLELFRSKDDGGTRATPPVPTIDPYDTLVEPDLDLSFHDEGQEGDGEIEGAA